MKDEIITVDEAARRLGVCATSVRRAVKIGLLEADYFGLLANRISGIKAASVNALLERRAHHA